jgi:hypothetical protein
MQYARKHASNVDEALNQFPELYLLKGYSYSQLGLHDKALENYTKGSSLKISELETTIGLVFNRAMSLLLHPTPSKEGAIRVLSHLQDLLMQLVKNSFPKRDSITSWYSFGIIVAEFAGSRTETLLSILL